MLPHKYFFLLFVAGITLCSWAGSESSLRVGIYEGLSAKFKHTNGVMWSDRVLTMVFEQAGYQIRYAEYPARRLALTLFRGDIDVYLSSAESISRSKYQTDFIRSALPVSVVTWFIYFDHRNQWQPSWPPDALMRSKIGKSRQSSESLKTHWHLQVTQSASVDAMVKMVNLARADYWVENGTGLRVLSPGLLKTPEQGFSYQPLFVRPLYIYFRKSPRGRSLANSYDQGFKILLNKGDYRRVYHIEDPNPELSDTVTQTLAYLKKHHSGMFIAPQKPLENKRQ